jgi:two-component system sensor histidine kinase YesM
LKLKDVIPNLYYNIPVRMKLVLWFAPLLLVTIGITGVYSYNVASNEIINKMSQEQVGSAHEAIAHLDYVAQDALDISNYFYLSPEIQALLSSDSTNGNLLSIDINSTINRMMVTRPFFQFLTIYSSHFSTIEFNNKGLSSAISFEEYKKQFNYDSLIQGKDIAAWSVEVPNKTKSIFYGNNKNNKLLLTKTLKNDFTLHSEGLIIIGMDESDVRKTYSSPDSQAQILITTKEGIVLSDSKGMYVGDSIQTLPFVEQNSANMNTLDQSIDNAKWVFSHQKSQLTGWHVIVLQPRSYLLKQLNPIKTVTFSIMCIAFLFILLFSWAASAIITRPLKSILFSMKKFQKGDFSQFVDSTGRDEIGQLGTGYNTMVHRIKKLVDDVFSFELKKREAELKLLQSQINPHFLYNTLNTISWAAQKKGETQIAEMIYSLSNIFQISLSNGKDIITIQEEIQLVNSYLFLQKMRFSDRLTYEISVDPDLEDVEVLKLLIQPLIENSIVHGIEPLDNDEGLIQIAVKTLNDSILIEIIDNGIGINALKLKTIQDSLIYKEEIDQSSTRNGFAFYNIINRLKLFYGDRASLTVESTEGSGTIVILIFPKTKR